MEDFSMFFALRSDYFVLARIWPGTNSRARIRILFQNSSAILFLPADFCPTRSDTIYFSVRRSIRRKYDFLPLLPNFHTSSEIRLCYRCAVSNWIQLRL